MLEVTQDLFSNAFMEPTDPKKLQENFSLPPELRVVVDPIINVHGRKKKWQFYAAAVFALMEKGDAAMGARIGEVASARHSFPGGFQGLVAKYASALNAYKKDAPAKKTTAQTAKAIEDEGRIRRKNRDTKPKEH